MIEAPRRPRSEWLRGWASTRSPTRGPSLSRPCRARRSRSRCAWRENEPDEKVSDLADRAFALLESGINYPAAG
ncbi:hypothetical protein [Phytohabitans kaempferiae]|uniref:Uncharacterized protein n=1 Tax=Phytohabitans kaempferiae TaxID=1620943 RepID=A0ABV6ME74_9ACTN